MIQFFKGLEFVHQNNIIHLDIKPCNILIKIMNDKIILKITDFGLSRELNCYISDTEKGTQE
jgi:serine/threonine protein kinase